VLEYAIRRVLWTVPVLLLCVTILFGLLKATGVDPLRHSRPLGLTSQAGWVKYGDWRPQGVAQNMRRHYGLDRPLWEQYVTYVGSLARFDFGPTFSFRDRTVNDVIEQQGPITAELVGLALLWAVVAGVPLAVAAALRRGSWLDRAITALTATTLGLPSFFVAALLVWVFAQKLGLVPVFGWDAWTSKILPTLVLALVPMSLLVRVLRASLLDAFGEDYVLTARGKGLRRRRVVAVHALRPALIPVVSMSGPLLGQLVTGLFIVEWVFAIPGLGRYFVAAAGVGDVPLTLGLTVVLTVAIVTANLGADLTLRALDPRTRELRV
jgi:oligopeptide transport system permease protein